VSSILSAQGSRITRQILANLFPLRVISTRSVTSLEKSMTEFIAWLLEQRGWVVFAFAVLLYVVLLILWFGYGMFWPFGFGLATVLAIAGPLWGKRKDDAP